MKLKQEELVNLLRGIKGTTFVTASVVTDVATIGGVEIKCEQSLNSTIGFSYANSVERMTQKEGKDVSVDVKPRAWGVLSENKVLVEHKGNYYLQLKVERRLNNKDTSSKYFTPDGKELDYETEVKPFKKESKKSSTQSHLDGEVVVRTVKMENIKKIKMLGTEYEVI